MREPITLIVKNYGLFHPTLERMVLWELSYLLNFNCTLTSGNVSRVLQVLNFIGQCFKIVHHVHVYKQDFRPKCTLVKLRYFFLELLYQRTCNPTTNTLMRGLIDMCQNNVNKTRKLALSKGLNTKIFSNLFFVDQLCNVFGKW